MQRRNASEEHSASDPVAPHGVAATPFDTCSADPASIPLPLRRWYLENRRDLPWRESTDPYRVWISEIMLQQTQVTTVIDYYRRFLKEFPTVEHLARANEEHVLELWAGLGYYSRGRNLLRAARTVVGEYQGNFPEDPVLLRRLQGVGEYTAAAIGSIAFGHEVAAIDGNVERVLSRVCTIAGDLKKGIGRRSIRGAADLALDRSDPGTHNQAMMELGALVCKPKAPRCQQCPLRSLCRAYACQQVEHYPQPKVRRPQESQEWVAIIVDCGTDSLLFRTESDAELLPNQWGVPLLRHKGKGAPSQQWIRRTARELARRKTGLESKDLGTADILPPIRHGITYRKLEVTPVRFSVDPTFADRIAEDCASSRYRSNVAIPSLFEKILRQGEEHR